MDHGLGPRVTSHHLLRPPDRIEVPVSQVAGDEAHEGVGVILTVVNVIDTGRDKPVTLRRHEPPTPVDPLHPEKPGGPALDRRVASETIELGGQSRLGRRLGADEQYHRQSKPMDHALSPSGYEADACEIQAAA